MVLCSVGQGASQSLLEPSRAGVADEPIGFLPGGTYMWITAPPTLHPGLSTLTGAPGHEYQPPNYMQV